VEAGLFFVALVGLLVLAVGAFRSGRAAQTVLGGVETTADTVFSLIGDLSTLINHTATVSTSCTCTSHELTPIRYSRLVQQQFPTGLDADPAISDITVPISWQLCVAGSQRASPLEWRTDGDVSGADRAELPR
jgi:hypothetical protein